MSESNLYVIQEFFIDRFHDHEVYLIRSAAIKRFLELKETWPKKKWQLVKREISDIPVEDLA